MTFTKHRISAAILFILFLKVLEYIPRTIEASQTQNSVPTSNNIREAIDYLNFVENKFQLNEKHKNVTLVFGYTKEGTTTLVQWLATDGKHLSAEAIVKHSPKSYMITNKIKTKTSSDPTTKFPELVVDQDPRIAFYDFPGFNDSQTVKDELAAKYFIQKVINYVEFVKIVLVMSQPMNRTSCIKLMRQVTHFVKNIEKFRDSIAIVVTKVVNSEKKELNREFEINKVATLLQNVKKELKTDNNSIELIDKLLTKNEGKYSRIGIFPKPNECGPLNRSNAWLKKYKESIQKIIRQTLKFTPTQNNFHHLKLDKNKSFINDLEKEINKTIHNTTDKIANDIKKYYHNIIEKIHWEIQSFNNFKRFSLENYASGEKLSEIIMEIYDLKYITSIEEIYNIITFPKTPPLYNDITNQYSYLKFLKPNITPSKNFLSTISTDLTASCNSLLTDIDNATEIIRNQIASKVNDIERKIEVYYESETKILQYQKAVDELNHAINILNSFIVPNKDEPEYISKFLNEITETVSKLNIDEDARKEINDERTDCMYMKNRLDFLAAFKSLKKYQPSNLSGNPFHNAIVHLNDLQTWYKFLSDLYMKRNEEFNENIKTISTSSLNIRDFYKNAVDESKLNEWKHLLYLMAPKDKKQCSEQGEYIITDYNVRLSDYIQNNDTLECINGDKVKTIKIFALNIITIDEDLYAKDTQQVSIIAQTWNITSERKIILNGAPADDTQPLEINNCTFSLEGQNGINGKPGLPGNPAGHFIGIGREFINSASLTISANGGDGGNGQDGGNGCPGENGKPVQLRYSLTTSNDNSQTLELDFLRDKNSYSFQEFTSPTTNIITYKINGTTGGRGGNGGDGGKGGKGGYAGKVKIIHLNKNSSIHVFTNNGNTGRGGKGGEGGVGGRVGDTTIITYMPGNFTAQQHIPHSDITGPNGTKGLNDFNEEDIIQPKLSSPPTTATIVNQYKKYLGEILKNTTHKTNSIKDFYTKLDENNDIEQSYNISHRIQEFYNLEDNLYRTDRQDLFLPFYQTLLNRIKFLLLNTTDNEVLKYLRATISSKINNLENKANSILIVDLYQYLTYIITKMKDIQTSEKDNSQLIAMNSYKCNYIKVNILKRIEELKTFTIEITNEIVGINKQIDEKINTLVDEITNRKEIDEKRIELQQILISKIILKIANITQQALGITKDEKKSVASLTLAIANNSSKSSLFLNDMIYKNIINTIKNNKISNLNNSLYNIYRELSKYEKEFIDILVMINNTSKQLNIRRNYEKLNIDDIIMLEKNLTNKLKEYETNNISKSADAMNVLKNINRKIQTFSFIFDIYDKSKQNPNILNEISKAIADNKSIVQKLEQNVFDIIATLRNTRVDYTKAINKLDLESPKSSDVHKLHVQHILRNVQLEIKQLSQSQEYNITSYNLKHYLGKLDEAMTTLIIVYDNIEYYKGQETLMNYIASINSRALRNIIADDPNISEDLRKLKNSLNYNLIKDQYKLIMNSFKQWVFPLASEYLKSFTSPSYFNSKNSIANSISDAIARIQSLYENINRNRTTLANFDEYIFKEEFDSSGGYMRQPFYIWKNEDNVKEISNLLTGKSVQLNANILQSPHNKYAIKFYTIGIYFKSKNKTLQSIINEEMKKYNIRIIHKGDSYYRYRTDYYLISSSRAFKIEYSFETNSEGEPKSKNNVYDKIKYGIPLLSPYATWELKLISSEQNSNFDTLSSFKNKIDLELIGRGCYLKPNTRDLEVENYYAEQKYLP